MRIIGIKEADKIHSYPLLFYIQDAKRAWIAAALDDGVTIPEPDELNNYSGQFKLRIPKSLHKQLADHSKREGISMNQYCLYLLTKNDAQYAK